MKKVLYLSYDGLSDPLGQSQILPYVCELSKKGYKFSLISFEKKEAFNNLQDDIRTICKKNNIEWHPEKYTKKPPVFSTLLDLKRLRKKVNKIIKNESIQLIHVRSYLPMFSALNMKEQFNVPVLFDMRGFWADERVEGDIWNLNSFIYKTVFNFFKRKERDFFQKSSHIISLTSKAKTIIEKKYLQGHDEDKITVIPCCADFAHFKLKKENQKKEDTLRKFGFSETDKIICYLGSLGTWYLLDEMLEFCKGVLESRNDFKLLFLTNHEENEIKQKGKQLGLNKEKIHVQFANRNELSDILNCVDFGIFFIKPSYSKQASSPTKMAEFLAKGIPVIANGGVGDVEELIKNYDFGFVSGIENLEGEALRFKEELEEKRYDPAQIRNQAEEVLSLKFGVQKYTNVYKKLIG